MLRILVLALVANIFAQGYDTAYVPVKVNVAATLTIELPDTAPPEAKIIEPSNGKVTVQANTPTTLILILGNSGSTPIKHNLQTQGSATITIYSINGERIFNDQNVASGAYLLFVKDAKGKSFTHKIAHRGGRLNISTVLGKNNATVLAKEAAASNDWKITAVPKGFVYQSAEHIFNPVKGQNSEMLITLPPTAYSADWTPTVSVFAVVEKPSTSIANSDVQNMAATNVALSWSLRPNVTKYEVYKDGELLGSTTGNVMEDYDLTIGKIYEYIVAGYAGTNKILSTPVQATPFAAAAAPGTWRYMNRNSEGGSSETTVTAAAGGGGLGGVAGADNKRYEFQVTGDGTLRTFQYRTSTNGTSWSNWTNLPSSPGGSSALTVGSWTGNLNGTKTTINPAAFVSSGTTWNGASGQTGINLEGVHWYRVPDKGLSINGFQEGKYVLGCHREPSGNYNLAHFMLVSCYPNNGKPYGEITYSGRPFGFESRDQRIFVDNDGTPYAMCSALGDSHFFKLDPNWKEPIEHTNHVFKGAYKETPDILRYGDWYFYFGSRQNGWYPSQVQYAMSKNIGGTWSELKDFGNVVTFGAQFNGIRTDSYGDGKTAYGFYSYRWSNQWDGISKESNGNPRRFSILNIHGDYVSSHWFNNIVYYPAHGYVGIRPGRNLSLGKKVTAPSSQKQANLQAVTDGMETSAAPRYENNSTPYELVIDLEKASVIREITVTTRIVGGSESPAQYTLSGSTNGSSYTQLANASSNGQPGFVVHVIDNATAYRYVKLSVSKFNDVRHNNNNTVSWADGVYEVAVYGTWK